MIKENGIFRRNGGLIHAPYISKKPHLLFGGDYVSGFGGGGSIDNGPDFVTASHTKAVDLDGSTEILNKASASLNIGDVWSVETWCKADAGVASSGRTFFSARGGTNNNRMIWDGDDMDLNPGKLRFNLWDSSGTAMKAWSKTGVFALSTNIHLVVTNTGGTVKIYQDGAEMTGITKTTDNTGTMTDIAREISIGSDHAGSGVWHGEFSTCCIWNVVLDSTNVTAIYNGAGGSGTGYLDDMRVDQGNYDQSAALQHQWKFGNDGTADANIGVDYVPAANSFNLMDDSANITTADITTF
jgi:hypothetical protein